MIEKYLDEIKDIIKEKNISGKDFSYAVRLGDSFWFLPANDLNNYYKTHDKIYVKPYIEPYSTNILLLTFPGLKDKVFEGKRLENSLDLATFIYSKAGVATVPGEGFFIDGKEMVLRIPISIPASELIEGFKAIKQVFIR